MKKTLLVCMLICTVINSIHANDTNNPIAIDKNNNKAIYKPIDEDEKLKGFSTELLTVIFERLNQSKEEDVSNFSMNLETPEVKNLLSSLEKEGTYNQIRHKWFHEKNTTPIPFYIYIILSIVCILRNSI